VARRRPAAAAESSARGRASVVGLRAGYRLVSAVERDDVGRLQQVLDSVDEHHLTSHAGGIQQLAKCLYIAAARGRLDCARLLLRAGAQPNIRGDTNGNTPLVRSLLHCVSKK